MSSNPDEVAFVLVALVAVPERVEADGQGTEHIEVMEAAIRAGGMSHIGSYPGWGNGQAINNHGNGFANQNPGGGHRQASKIESNQQTAHINNIGNGFANRNQGSDHRPAPNINLPKPSAPKVVNHIKIRNQFFVRNDVYRPPVASMAVIRGWRVRPLVGFRVHFDLHAPYSHYRNPHYWMDQHDDRRTCEILTSRSNELKPTDLEKWKFACTVYDSVPGKCNIELLNNACFDPMAYTRAANCLEQNLPEIESQCLEEAQVCCKFKQRNGLCEMANVGQKCGEQAVKFHYKLPKKICEKCDLGANDGSVSEQNASRNPDFSPLLNSTEEIDNEGRLKDAIANHKDVNTALQEHFGRRRLNGNKNGSELASHSYETLVWFAVAVLLYFIR
ncbi:hypothetical protein DdX_10136 [Ditylenchus destructor]|uniref:Uncharacterized protein n=1 Tax=Ditylenchus destructor TaxID=166010 RepID=A0AAD4R5Y5_9BILA|nr:hypothetical protein DdX_10136 [Ditylenchus destructor]